MAGFKSRGPHRTFWWLPHRAYVNTPRIKRSPSAQAGQRLAFHCSCAFDPPLRQAVPAALPLAATAPLPRMLSRFFRHRRRSCAFPAPRDSRARGRRKFMTAPVKERGTRRSLPLRFCSTFRISLRSRSVRPAFRNSLWGKNLSRGRARGFQGQRPNFPTPGRGLQGSPARRSRDAPERPSLPPRRRTAAL